MAKHRERSIAKQLFIQGKTHKEIALLVGVQEKTIGDWVKKYGWKEERTARIGSSKKQVQNLKDIISRMAERRLEVFNDLMEAKECKNKDDIERLEKEASKLDDGVSRWNKTLENIDTENRVSLAVYLDVMDDIFKALQNYNIKLFMETIDFQDQHLTTISLKLG
jgi:transposase